MSLADELNEAASKADTTADWFARWRASLNKADQAAVDEWLADPTKSVRALWEVCRKHGYPRASKTFRDWVAGQRGGR